MSNGGINIDGVEYTEDQLTDEQKYLASQCQDLMNKEQSLRFQLHQIEVARKQFADALIQSVKDDGDESDQ